MGTEIVKAIKKEQVEGLRYTSVKSVYKWIHNYLSDHTQCLVVIGTKSASLPNHSGIPLTLRLAAK